MIQRIQSIILFLISAILMSLLFMPIWTTTDKSNGSRIILDALSLKIAGLQSPVEKHTYYIGVIAVLAAITAMYSIFQYRNRMLQLKLGMLNSLLISILLGTFFWAIKQGNAQLLEPAEGEFLIGFYVPMIAIILNFAANRFIKKDEALVRSVDRLR